MADLVERLRQILPPGISLGIADLQANLPNWPGEEIPKVVPKRRAEFAAGRAAARQALSGLGMPATAIPMGADRAPVWPAGITGSISHCEGACLAIAARTEDFCGLGIDVEPLTPIAPDLWPTILHPKERAALPQATPQTHGLHVLKIFVAKEAVYKAQYARSRTLIGFDAFTSTFTDQELSLCFEQPVPPFRIGDRIAGRYTASDSHFAAIAWLVSA